MFVLVTTNDPRYWDDGIKDIIGPFDTVELAREWGRKNPDVNQEYDLFEIKSPDDMGFKLTG